MNMKIYKEGRQDGKHIMYVQPGNEIKDVAEFFDEARVPILFAVEFMNGVAKVSSSLGRYMIDKGIAKASPIVIVESIPFAFA